jgi:type VI secretion system secreted protein Hcp
LVESFLRIDGLQGEVTDRLHGGDIPVLSYSWSEGFSTPPTRSRVGRLTMSDLTVQKPVYKASPKLFLACAKGQNIQTAVLSLRKSSTSPDYLKWKLYDVVLSSYGTSLNPGDQVPTEHITLSFQKIEIEYSETLPDGTLRPAIKAGWDKTTNKPT